MAHAIHPGEPHDWLWLGPDIRHQQNGSFKEVCVRVCIICLTDSAPSKNPCSASQQFKTAQTTYHSRKNVSPCETLLSVADLIEKFDSRFSSINIVA